MPKYVTSHATIFPRALPVFVNIVLRGRVLYELSISYKYTLEFASFLLLVLGLFPGGAAWRLGGWFALFKGK